MKVGVVIPAYNGERYTPVYTNSYFVSPKMEEYGVTVALVGSKEESNTPAPMTSV